MNHYALFIKLIERDFPTKLLNVLETWFCTSIACVKWGRNVSSFISLHAGVRQGGVLSPILFSVFIDDIVAEVKVANVGCCISTICVSIFLYADDVILVAPSVSGLQSLLYVKMN